MMGVTPQLDLRDVVGRVPQKMLAAVYHGINDVRMETVAVPQIGPGELLVRIHTCGICGTDLKKVATGSHSAPRIFGHEMAGVVVRAGRGVTNFAEGDRVMVFHHIPCRNCFYCRRKVFAQCETYKRVGTTAGYGEPSGGGFAEYIRVMDWIVNDGGVIRIPDDVSFEQASHIEPVNTVWKAVDILAPAADETVLVIGQGPIGLLLAYLAKRRGANVLTSDLFDQRLTMSAGYGLTNGINASTTNVVPRVRELTEERGADDVVLAVGGDSLIRTAIDAARPGGRVMLFAQTTRGEAKFDPASVCVDEKILLGSYSASVELNDEVARFVFSREMDLEKLYSHRFPLEQALEALRLAANPQPDTMKIAIQPGSNWEG
ncbi:MAG TPA: zinc-dependent dehydrogenase [candidate division Zixibacteria bacterium]|nr:zinc-dependent dehydrogenase [candidate division Zixibacteria bacterium]